MFNSKQHLIDICESEPSLLTDITDECIQIEVLRSNPGAIVYLDNPSEKIQQLVVESHCACFPLIRNPTENICLQAIKKLPRHIKYIDNPSNEMCLMALRENVHSVQGIKHITQEMIDVIINTPNGICVAHLIIANKNTTEDMLISLVEYAPYSTFRYIKNPTQNVIWAALKSGHGIIARVESPSEEMQLYAVEKNHSNIKHLKNPTKAVQLAAIQGDSRYIRYGKLLSDDEKIEILQRNPECFSNIQFPSEKICCVAIKLDAANIFHMKNPTNKIIKEAMKDSRFKLSWLTHVTKETLDFYRHTLKHKTFKYTHNEFGNNVHEYVRNMSR